MDPPRKYLIHSLNPWRQFLFIWRQKHFFSRQFLYMDPVSPGKGLFCPNFFFHFFNAKGAKLFFHQENSLFSTGQGLYAPIIFYHFFKPRVESYFLTRKINYYFFFEGGRWGMYSHEPPNWCLWLKQGPLPFIRMSQVTWRLFTPQEQFFALSWNTIGPFFTNILTFQFTLLTPSSLDEEIKEDMLHPL